jgi:hypothetical protein
MSINFLEPNELWFQGKDEFHPDAKIELAISPHGLSSGKPSVLMRITVDGKSFVVPTTARLFATMGKMITARYPDLFEGE